MNSETVSKSGKLAPTDPSQTPLISASTWASELPAAKVLPAGFLDGATAWWTGLVLMLATLLVPLLITPVPPLLDYPNHLARCYLLAFGNGDPILRQMFVAHWRIIPNIAIDLILPGMMHIFSPLTAGRIMLAFCILLPTTGAIALSYAWFRRRSLWQLATGFAAFNALFLLGFMNFEIAIGMAMWAAAAWIMYRESRPIFTVALACLFTPLVFFFHLFGLCFYALLVGSYEIFVLLERRNQHSLNIGFAAKRTAVLFVPMIVPAILYLASPLEKVSLPPLWKSIPAKVYLAFDSMLSYSPAFDFFVVASLIAFIAFCFVGRRARVSKIGLICASVLLGVYAVAPFSLKGVHFVDSRLTVMLAFIVFASFTPIALSRRERNFALALFAIIFVARMAFITDVWHDSQRDLADVRQVIEPVTPGSRVLVAYVSPEDNPAWDKIIPKSRRVPKVSATYWHLASFVLIDRHAFWPNIFAEEYQQPIQIISPYREIEAVRAPPLKYKDLADHNLPPEETSRFPFLSDWRSKFDYVLILNAEGAPDLDHFLPDELQPINRQGIAALLRVRN